MRPGPKLFGFTLETAPDLTSFPGVDYRHPSLGGGFGPGFKIAGGYSFVDDAWSGQRDPIESPDPLATCSSNAHGSHTSGLSFYSLVLVHSPNFEKGSSGCRTQQTWALDWPGWLLRQHCICTRCSAVRRYVLPPVIPISSEALQLSYII